MKRALRHHASPALRKPRPLTGSIAALTASLSIFTSAQAATVYWDINGLAPGASDTSSAVGIWDATNAFWNAAADGTGAFSAWNPGDTAVFSSGANASQAFTITVAGTQQIGGLGFEDGAVTLTGGILQMTAGSNVDVAAGLRATVNSAVDGAFNLTKTGLGLLVLGGTNTYSGNTLLNAGTLSISTGANLGAAPLVGVADNIRFTGNSTLQVTGTANPTISSNRGITLDTGVNGALQVVDSANAVTYGGVVTGVAGTTFTKTGAGTLDVQGNSTAAFLGALNVDGGTLQLSGNGAMAGTSGVTIGNRGRLILNNTAANLSDRIGNGLTSNGGTLSFTHSGAAGSNYAESAGVLTLNAGALTLNGSQAAVGQTSAVTFDSITRSAGGTLLFSGVGAGVNSQNELLLTSVAGLPAAGAAIPWAVVTDGTGANTGFATHSGAGTSLSRLTTYNTGAMTTWLATDNARPLADDTTNNANQSVNTITLDNGVDLLGTSLTADRTITLSGAGGGAILQTGGASSITNNGTSAYVFGFGTNEALFHTLGDLDILTSSTPETNLTGSGGLTKSGAGTLIIRGNSSITGTWRVNEGILEGRLASSFGATQPMQLNGGTLRLSNNASTTYTISNITVAADSAIQVDRVTAAATSVTHTVGGLTIGGGRTLTVNSNDIDAGTAYGLTTGSLTVNSGGATFDVANNGAGLGTMTVGAITNIGDAITKRGAGDLITSSITTGFSGPVDIQAGRIGWSGASGVINEPGPITGAGGIIKSGAGTVNLTGPSSFTGGITLSAGTLGFSSIGDSVDPITISGGVLSFIGAASQSTNRPINMTSAATLNASGTAGATINYTGPINANAINPTFTGTGAGIISGGLTQTGIAATATISSGTWTFQTNPVTIANDLIVLGPTAVLNLNSTGVLTFGLSADASLRAYSGGTINFGANDPVTAANFDGLRIGTDGTGVGTLNTGTFNQTATEFILGNRNFDRSGVVNGTGTITATTNLDLYSGTVNANLASTGTLSPEKISSNTVTLAGDNSGLASTGAFIVYEGGLTLDYTNNTATKLRTASQLDMRGSNLTLIGNASTAVSQSVGSFTLGSNGSSRITLNPVNGKDLVLNLGAITRSNVSSDGTLRLVLPAGTQSATNGITTTSPNSTFGMLGTGSTATGSAAYATVDDGTGVWFATSSGGNVVALASTPKNDVTTWTAGDHVTDSVTGFTGTLTAADINSLRFNADAASAVAIAPGGTLNIASGGILMTNAAATGAHAISGGTLTATTRELVITQDSTAQALTISSNINQPNGITKSGAGTLILSGSNNHTGATEIQEGTLRVSGGNAIGDTALVGLSASRPSTFELLNDEVIGRLSGGNRQTDSDYGTVAIGSNKLTINQTAGDTTYAGFITGTGTLVKGSGDTSVRLLNLTNLSTGFTGDVVINGGLLQLSGVGRIDASFFAINKGGSLLIDNNSTTRSSTRILDTTPITLNSADGTSISGSTYPRGLWIRNDTSGTVNETIGDLNFNSGANYLTGEASGTTAISGVVAANFVRSNNATTAVRARNLGLTSGDRIQFRIGNTTNQTAFIGTLVGGGGAAGLQNISIVPWAIGETFNATIANSANMGNSLVTYVSGAGFRPLTFSEYDTLASAAANENARESLTANLTDVAPKTINALVLHNDNVAAAGVSVTGTGGTLAVTSGAMLFTLNPAAAVGNYGLTLGGFTDITTAGANPEYVIHVVNPDSAAPTKALTATISSQLSSTADITLAGRGVLVLSGNNTAGGGTKKTTLNEGTLEISSLANIGGTTGGLVFAGGTLRLGTGYVDDFSTRGVTFLGSGTVDTNGRNLTLAGSLGNDSGDFTKAGSGTLTLKGASFRTGNSIVAGGTLELAIASGALGDSTAANAIDLMGAELSLRNNGAGNNGTIIVGSLSNPAGYNVMLTTSGSTINVDNLTANTGNTLQLGTLSQPTAAARTLNVTGANGYKLGFSKVVLAPGIGGITTLNPTTASMVIGDVTNPMSGFANTNFDTLTLGGTSGENVITGNISDALGASLALGGYTVVTKSTAATWTLNGTGSTYTGATNLNAGILIAGTDTALGRSTITFAGGTLNNQDENRAFANDVLMSGTGTLTGTGNFAFNGNLSQTGGSRTLIIDNVGTTTFGDAATDTITLAENAQTRNLTLDVDATSAVIINSTVQAGTGSGADGLIKIGAGPLTINASNTYTGATTLEGGTTTFTTSQNLAATTNTLILGASAASTTPVTVDFDGVDATFGGGLTMNINSTTASTVTVDAGKTLTLNGNVQIGATTPGTILATSSLTITGGGNLAVATAAGGVFMVGGSTSTTNAQTSILNLTGLNSATIDVSDTGTVRVNQPTGTNIAGNQSTLLLPTPTTGITSTTPVTTIKANNFNVGDNGGLGSAPGQVNSVIFGTGLTTLNVNNVNIGTGGRDLGVLTFASGNGTLRLRAADGVGRAAFNIATGAASTGVAPATGTANNVDFTGHEVDLSISTLTIGGQNRNTNRTDIFTFDTGTLDATTVVVGDNGSTANGGASSNTWTSTLNLNGGTTIIGAGGLEIARGDTAVTGTDTLVGAVNIGGGTVTIANNPTFGAAVRIGNNTIATGLTTNGSLNITGGNVTVSGNIIRGATTGAGSATVTLNGGLLNMTGNSIGAASPTVSFQAQSGTLQNLAELNGGGALTKTSSGTLLLTGTNTYTGNTLLQNGRVIADGGGNNRLGTGGLVLGEGSTSGVLQLGNANGATAQTFTSLATSGIGFANAIVGGNAALSTLTVNQSTGTIYNGTLGGAGPNENRFNVVKSGSGVLTVSGASTYTGSTTVSGGTLSLGALNGTQSLTVTGAGSILDITGPLGSAASITNLSVGDGSTLRLLNGVGDKLSGLTTLTLGSTGGTLTTLSFNVGDVAVPAGPGLNDQLNTDSLTLTAGGTLNLFAGNQVRFNLTDLGLNPGQKYNLLASASGGLTTTGLTASDYLLGFTPGGFTSFTLTATDNLIYLTTGSLITGKSYWRGLTDTTWNANANNWSQDKAGTTPALSIPGQGTDVVFQWDAPTNAVVTTTLEQNFKINSLTFEASTTPANTPASVTINPGALATSRLAIGPQLPADGLKITAGGPATVTINAAVKLDAAQTWNVTNASTLVLTNSLTGPGALTINNAIDAVNSTQFAGTVILRGPNGVATYDSAANLVAGRLILEGGADTRLPLASAFTLGGGTNSAVLQLGDAVNGASNTAIGTLATAGSGTANAIVGGAPAVSTLAVFQSANATFAGVIGGAGTNENNVALLKKGASTLILDGANTYTGGTTIENGTLQLGAAGSITGALTITPVAGATATFDNNSRSTVLTGAITLGGADSAALPRITNTGGAGSIQLGGNVTYDGTNNPLGGSIAAPLNLGASSRTFTANDSTTAATDLTISGAVSSTAGSVGANGISLTLDGTGSGLIGAISLANGTTDGASADFTKNGTGTWTIQGPVTIGDDYLINGGTFTVATGGGLTWNATGFTSPDFVADNTSSAPVVNFNVADSLVGNSGTNRLFARDGATFNLNATGALGASIEQIILGDDNQGTGNVFLAPGTTNSVGRLDLGFNSTSEVGNVTGTGTLTVTTNLNLRNGLISANLDGAAALAKLDTLAVTLSGNNSLTGTTNLAEGTLTADYATSAGINNKLSAGNFSMGTTSDADLRPVLNLVGHATLASRQDLADFTVVGSAGQINLTGTPGVDNTLRITGALNRTSGTVHFTLADANKKLEYSGPTTTTNGILPAWMTLNRSDFLTIAENGAVDNLVAATYTTQDNAGLWGVNQNITNATPFSGTVDTSRNRINSLRFDAAGSSTVTVGNSLIVSSGGIMVTGNVGNSVSTITGGDLRTGTNEFFFHQNNTANLLTVASNLIGGAAITKTGAGTLLLSGTKNRTGTVTIEEGIIQLSGGSALSDSSTVIIRSPGGTANTGLELLANQTETIGPLTGNSASGLVRLNTGSTLTINQSSSLTFAGSFTGAGTLVKAGASTLTLTGNSSKTGIVTIEGGNLTLNGSGGFMAGVTTWNLNAGEFLNDQNDTTQRDRIGQSSDFILNNTAGTNGLFQRTNQGTTTKTENIGDIQIGAGHNVVTSHGNATSAISVLQADTLLRLDTASQTHGTALVRGNNLGTSNTTRGVIAFDPAAQTVIDGYEVGGGGSTTTNISIIPWLVGDLSQTGLGNTFVTNVDTVAGLRPLASTEYVTGAGLTGTLTDNARFTATTAFTATPTAINSLVLDSATAIALTGSASAMEVTSGAILAAGSANHSIGTITNITTGTDTLTSIQRDYTIFTTGTGTLTIDSALSSAVPLVKAGQGTLSLTNSGNAFTDVYFNQGAILVNDYDKLGTGNLKFAGGTLRLASGFADDLGAKSFAMLMGGGTLDTNGVNVLATNLGLTGSGSFTKIGLGTLTLTGGSASTYTGDFNVRRGIVELNKPAGTDAIGGGNLSIGFSLTTGETATLKLLADNQINDATKVSVRSAGSNAVGTFDLNGHAETIGSLTMGATTGAGVLVRTGAGGVLTVTGDITLSNDRNLNDTGTIPRGVLITGTGTAGTAAPSSGTLDLGGAVRTITVEPNLLSVATTIGKPDATIETIIRNGGIVKQGSRVLFLGGANTYAGSTVINEGAISITNSAALGADVAGNTLSIRDGAILQSTGANVSLGTNQTIALQGSGGTFDVTGSNVLTAAGALSGGDATTLTKIGTGKLALSAANSYTGPTRVVEGTLEISGSLSGTSGTGSTPGVTPGIQVEPTAKLLLSGASNSLNDTTLFLNGGTLAFSNSLGSSRTEGFGALTLGATSTLDFGSEAFGNTFQFSSLNVLPGFTQLTVLNWTGVPYSLSDTEDNGSNADKFVFNTPPGLSSADLAKISFFNDSGTFLGTGAQIGFGLAYEIVPVPEPSSTALLGAAGLLALSGFRQRRRARLEASRKGTLN